MKSITNNNNNKITLVSGDCDKKKPTLVDKQERYPSITSRHTGSKTTYGLELVAARIATDIAIKVRYILHMLGVEIDGSILMLGDNKSVVINTTIPSSTLKKKICAIAYHRVREAVAARIIRFCHIESHQNIADILTKPLGNPIFHHLVNPIVFRTPGEDRWPRGGKEHSKH